MSKLLMRRAERSRYEISCKSCQWRLKATIPRAAASFIITKLPDEHDSTRSGTNHLSHKQASARAIALKFINKVRQQPKAYGAAGIQKDVQLDGVLVPYKRAWRAKELAQEMIDGSHEDSYSLLPYYYQQIESTNPNRTAIVECYDETSKFRRLFLCYGSSACGVVHCHPVIGLDGTHLKAK
jgi:hypothetical protein